MEGKFTKRRNLTMKRTMVMLTIFLLGGFMPLRAQSLLEELQTDPSVMQALNDLNVALESPSLQGPVATVNELSSNPQALASLQSLENAQSLDQMGASLQDPFVQQYLQAISTILKDPGVTNALQDFQTAVMANPELAQAFQDPTAMEQLISELSAQAKRDHNLTMTLKHFLKPAF
jgi:hypothetical protein